MAFSPLPSSNLCTGQRSGFWGSSHTSPNIIHSIPIPNRGITSTKATPVPSCVCILEEQHLHLYPNASPQCSLPLANGVYPVALFSTRAFLPPFEASSLKTSTRLQRGLITFRMPGRWVCFGGGPRPKRPRIWRTRQRRGTVSKSQKLLDHVRPLSNVKEEVYGALDAFIAWEVEFPLIAVKKALETLKYERDWKRIIQISKWMIGKGQGMTLGTYVLLLEAFDHEGRIEEAQELWERVVTTNLTHTPRIFFSKMIFMFDRHQIYDELLEVFADMEELEIKPSPTIVNKVACVYEKLGILDKAKKVKEKYPLTQTIKHRTVNGKVIKFPITSTFQGSKGNSLEEIEAPRNFTATDSYASSVDKDMIHSAKDEYLGDSASLRDEVIGTGTRKTVGEEVQFA